MTDNERIQAIRNRVSARDFMYWSGGYANDDVEFLLQQLDQRDKTIVEMRETLNEVFELLEEHTPAWYKMKHFYSLRKFSTSNKQEANYDSERRGTS